MRLAYEDVLNKDVQAPPTEAMLTAYTRSQNIKDGLLLAFLATLLVGFLINLAFSIYQDNADMAGYGTVVFLVGLIIALTLAPGNTLDCSPIPQNACRKALSAFKKTPEGVIYLERLREQSRQVTWFDVKAATTWAATLKQRASEQLRAELAVAQKEEDEQACRELYGIRA